MIGSSDHTNLVFCPMLRLFVPRDGKSERFPLSLCVKCLNTHEADGSECRHKTGVEWKNNVCKISGMHYLLCKHCVEHKILHAWWRTRFNPADGYKNYSYLIRDLTWPVVRDSRQGADPFSVNGRRPRGHGSRFKVYGLKLVSGL